MKLHHFVQCRRTIRRYGWLCCQSLLVHHFSELVNAAVQWILTSADATDFRSTSQWYFQCCWYLCINSSATCLGWTTATSVVAANAAAVAFFLFGQADAITILITYPQIAYNNSNGCLHGNISISAILKPWWGIAFNQPGISSGPTFLIFLHVKGIRYKCNSRVLKCWRDFYYRYEYQTNVIWIISRLVTK